MADGFEEARYALLGATALEATALGGGHAVMQLRRARAVPRHPLRLALDPRLHDATIDAVSKVAAYDRLRESSLLHTLEQFLAHRGAISATAAALFVHPNTLRQRLRRMREISGIDLDSDDWLTVEIAVKLVRVRTALGMDGFDSEPG